MKKTILAVCLLLFVTISHAQNFIGTWEGRLKIPASLRIVFIFSTTTDGKLKASLQSPDQSSAILPTDTCYIKKDSIFTSAKKFGISFTGKLMQDSLISGTFTQGIDMELDLKKVEKVSEVKRPQTPKTPFAYNSKEVNFYNPDSSILFAGTITWPKKDSTLAYFREPVYPAVVLITGSGPQDRDETIMGHKPFAVLADYLTKKGFAVLRTDDRGVGKSKGKFATATTADFAEDAEAAIAFLKQQSTTDTGHIGIIGHSEGGMIAPMVAARRKDIHCIVLLAGPGIPITQLMEEQITAVAVSQGEEPKLANAGKEFYSIIANEINRSNDTNSILINARKQAELWAAKHDTAILSKMQMSSAEKRKEAISFQMYSMITPWFKYFLAFNPQPYLQKLTCKVLALNGSKDVQVIAKSNLAGIKTALSKSKSPKYDVLELPGLNHLFQTCKTCAVSEYATLEESFSPTALEIIGNWLLQNGR